MAVLVAPPPGQRYQAFPMPDSTPAPNAYPNLVGGQGSTGATVRFSNRKFRRTESSEENQAVCLQTLKEVWGYTSFREHQLDICMSAVRDRDIMMVAPTGLGKSLCFQLPALVLEYGLTIIVTPIKALMHDQIQDLKAKDIDAMLACGDTTQAEQLEIKKQFQMGHPRKRIMYITPESLTGPNSRWMNTISQAYKNGQLRRLVVDEAHCITEWGTTFRGSYRSLGEFRQRFPDVPISAFTASANKWTRSEIAKTLGMEKTNFDMWVLPVNRSNIFYEVAYRSQSQNCLSVPDYIASWVLKHIDDLRQRNHDNGLQTNTVTGIVYCRRVDQCETIADRLCESGIRAELFHAKMSTADKASVLRRWKEGKLDCVCATIAFGMGIDQAHVRYVVHYNLPKSFEGFYQETGRAGRDGHVSRSLLVYSREDANSVFADIGREHNKLETEQEQWRYKLLEAKGPAEKARAEEEIADRKVRLQGMKKQFRSLERLRDDLVENVRQCRHIAICRYFGETIPDSDDGDEWRKSYCDNMCDVCTNGAAVVRRFNLINHEIELPSQQTQDDEEEATAFEDEEAVPSSGITQSSSAAMRTLALMRDSSGYISHTSSGSMRSQRQTGGTPSASLLALADAVHRPGGARIMGLGRPHGPSRLGRSSPMVPATAEEGDEDEDANREDEAVTQGGSSGDRLLGPTQARPTRGLSTNTPQPSANAGSGHVIVAASSSSPVDSFPARMQMRTQAHTQARRRVGLMAYSSTNLDVDFSSSDANNEPPNLAVLGRKLESPSPRKNAVAGPSRLPGRSVVSMGAARGQGNETAKGKGKGKRMERAEGESEDEEDLGCPPKKRATDPAGRAETSAPRGKNRAREEDSEEEGEAYGGMGRVGGTAPTRAGDRRPLIPTKRTERASNTLPPKSRLLTAASSTDDLQPNKSSSPRPIPSIILPNGVSASNIDSKGKGKGKSKAGMATAKGKAKGKSAQAFTIDSIAGPGEGSYALPAPPADTDVARYKRKKQIEAFEAVEVAQGEGPYGYYNATAPHPGPAGIRTPRTPAQGIRGVAGPSSAGANVRSVGSVSGTPIARRAATQGFKTPFKTPFRRAEEKGRMGPILASTRKEMLAKIQAGLLKYSDCAVWAYWGVPDEGREKGIKKVARSVEHHLAAKQYCTTDYTPTVKSLLHCLKLLGVSDVVQRICNGDLAGEFGEGEAGGMMRLVEAYAQGRAET